jgi:hypothetical protein
MALDEKAVLRGQFVLALRVSQLKKFEGAKHLLMSVDFDDQIFMRRYPITYLRVHETAKSGAQGAQMIADSASGIVSAIRARLEPAAIENAIKDIRNALQPYELGHAVDAAVEQLDSGYGGDDDIPF